ncbi:hypothetical protein EZS27_001401 [termite gut metagenome]|uniref:Uncharacterized protein n=1 Tax=termite gut metagenome TaxID=433724 RepID=A0A5J4T1D7_9ZZZZ
MNIKSEDIDYQVLRRNAEKVSGTKYVNDYYITI